jgi:RNA polymerase sigma-70 factor, ECF subfamily
MASLNSLSETELMTRVIRQDQQALAELYDRFGGLVFSLARHVLQDAGMAEEITQDIFLKVWQQALTWDESRGKFVSWLMTMTRYTAIDRLRKEQRRPIRTSSSIDDLYDVIADTEQADESLRLDGETLRVLMTRLPSEQTDLIQLAFFGGLSHSEIANRTGLPLGTVKTRLRLGMQKLKGLWQSSGLDENDASS